MALYLGVGLVGKLLLRLDHTKVDILLVSSSDLLLLLLQKLNLLCKSELFHCRIVSRGKG